MRSLILLVTIVVAITNSASPDDRNDVAAGDAPSPLTAPFDAVQAKAAQDAWAKSLGRASQIEKNSIGMELVLIPPGKFQMGSPASEKDRSAYEEQVDVMLTKAYYIGKTEVTQGQWRAAMGTTPWQSRDSVREGDNFAATFVSWMDAQEFCKKLSEKENAAYRLPSEAEWEYACRGGSTTRFAFGDDDSRLGEFAWHGKNSWDAGERYAHEVGRKQPNSFGLYDMHGNVWEMCDDVKVDELPGGTDPLVTRGGSSRVARGGCWFRSSYFCRTAIRFSASPSRGHDNEGFRVARSPGN
jgi:formylglycine-generating enzyme required for sulfatase activity